MSTTKILNTVLLAWSVILVVEVVSNAVQSDPSQPSGRAYYPSTYKRFRRGYGGSQDESSFKKYPSFSKVGSSDPFGTFRKDSIGSRKGSSRGFPSRSFTNYGGPDAFLSAGVTEKDESDNKDSIGFPRSSNAFSNFGQQSNIWGRSSSTSSKGRAKGGGSSIGSGTAPNNHHSSSKFSFDNKPKFGSPSFGSSSSNSFGSGSSFFGNSHPKPNPFRSSESTSQGFGKKSSFFNHFGGQRPTGTAGFSSGPVKTFGTGGEIFKLPDNEDESPFGVKSPRSSFSSGSEMINFGSLGNIEDFTKGEIKGPLKNFDITAFLSQLEQQESQVTTKKPRRIVSQEDHNKIFSGSNDDEERDHDGRDSETFIPLAFPETKRRNSKSRKSIKKSSGTCGVAPSAPSNAKLKCTSRSGCIMDCNDNYKNLDGDTRLYIKCTKGQWVVQGQNTAILPDCEPICDPPCQNNGICLKPYFCLCSDQWDGPQCDQSKETQLEQCFDKPPVPLNTKIFCGQGGCIARCIEGYEFDSGITKIMYICQMGSWTIQNQDSELNANCEPVCDPPCLNGGVCLAPNLCECTKDFRGLLCQYPISNCDPKKLNFNGGYNCSGEDMDFGCKLWCPQGISFISPPKEFYKCDYATSRWSPTQIPQCDYSFLYATQAPLGDLKIVETPKPKRGICFTWSGKHYKSFDGKVYSFESDCPYTLLQDAILGTFSINLMPEENCKERNCPRSLKLFTEGDQYILRSDGLVPKLIYANTTLAIPSQMNGLVTERVAHFVVLKLLGIGLTLKWDSKNLVIVEVSELLWNRTSGLCGRLDGNKDNDWSYADGTQETNFNTFLKAWQATTVGEICSKTPTTTQSCSIRNEYAANQFCSRLANDPRFENCRMVLDYEPFMKACKWDYCNCDNHNNQESCACESLSAFFRECTNVGGAVEGGWRDYNFCSMECSGNLVYKSCMPAIQPRCGQAAETPKPEFCVEGCDCENGLLLNSDGKCISKVDCPCTYHNKTYSPGDNIPNDCNSCACVAGAWVCTEVKCGSRCSSIGDPHYTTFDGKKFDFMGQCSYYLVKGTDYSIEAENVACAGAISKRMNFPSSLISQFPSCTKSLTLRIPGTIVHLKQGRDVVINGEEITDFPVWANEVFVKKASSLFLAVYLPNGIEVWWDGQTRAYIDAPAEMRGSTAGLCGTFNDNQKDDFLSPEGDTELNSIAFANKWKTSEKCMDVNILQDFTSPCERHIQNKEVAEKHCAKIMQNAFSNCHLVVDPENFYRNCMYDVCSCEDDIKNCVCPIFSAYGKECAHKGVFLDWRATIRECGIHCTGGQKYQICGDSCSHSCFDIATNPNCKRKCVEGCNCAEGFSLDVNEECVPIQDCPCIYQGKEYKPEYEMFQTDEIGEQMLCKCSKGQWTCREPNAIEKSSPEFFAELQLDCSQLQNEMYTDCIPDEEMNCLTMHLRPEKHSEDVCRPGCRCAEGFVRDKDSKQCIDISDCPCHHGGKSYKENNTIVEQCNTCICKDSIWACTNNPCPAICTAWGDSHFKSFDGRVFDFHGMCDYMLAKGKQSRADTFEISIQNIPCGTNGVTCAKSLTLRVGTGDNQEVVSFSRNKPTPSKNLTRIIIREAGVFVIAEVSDMGLELQWDKGTRAYIILHPSWLEKQVQGLCGNYNEDENDDLRTPSGGTEVSAKLFGDSWRLQNYCPESIIIKDTCALHPHRKVWATEKCAILKSSVFVPCHLEVSVEPYVERCQFDSCGCDTGGDCECLCTAIAAYAQECNIHGVPIKWRTPEICPMQCDESCEHYEPCIPTCPTETCDSYKEPPSTLCRKDVCVEGCAKDICPPGSIRKSKSDKDCIPVTECENKCMEIDGVVFMEGELISEDECHTCFCSKNKKTCQGIPCETTISPPPEEYSQTTPATEVEGTTEQTTQCRSGWTKWINNDHPIFHKKNSDIETIPSKFMRTLNPSFGFCTDKMVTDIRCRSFGDQQRPTRDVTCNLEEGLRCVGSKGGKQCKDYEISLFCNCQLQSILDITTTSPNAPVTAPTLVTPITTPVAIDLPMNCKEEGWSQWFNSHFPNEKGEFETLSNIRKTNTVCPNHYIKEFECRPVDGRYVDKTISCSKNGAMCRNNGGLAYCKDYEFRVYCQCKCQDGLGMEDGTIPNESITTSSNMNNNPNMGRLNSDSPWVPKVEEKLSDNWIQIDLGARKEVTGIITQGHPSYPAYIKKYALQTSEDGSEWKELRNDGENFAKNFLANENSYESVTNLLPVPLYVQYLRLIPIEAVMIPALRIELKGCDITDPIPESSSTPTLALTNATTSECNFGWTQWMNSHVPSPDNWDDIENYNGLRSKYSFCNEAMISKVECRAAVTRVSAKHSNQNEIVCNKNFGLQCISELQKEYCYDYEIRFFCDCDNVEPEITTVASHITAGVIDDLCEPDPTIPTKPHESDCQKFYECQPLVRGGKKVLKSCGPGTLYNPNTFVCDWPAAVYAIREDCGESTKEARIEMTTSLPPINYTDVRTATPSTSPRMYNDYQCPPGHYYEDFAIRCARVCIYYRQFLMRQGRCLEDDDEAPACIDEVKGQACPRGFFLRNNSTCVSITDCNCMLPNGISAPPERTFLISDCEICKCSNNELICDNKRCYGKPKEFDCDEWSPWMSVSAPAGEGDIESISLLKRYHPDVCWDPVDIECRVKRNGIPSYRSEQKVSCNRKTGLKCFNKHNHPSGCEDYEVRIKCACEEGSENQEIATTTSIPKKYSPTLPSLPGCIEPYWTEWFNVTHPFRKGGDYELIDVISRKGLDICPKEYITEIECAFYKRVSKSHKSHKGRRKSTKGRPSPAKYTSEYILADYTESDDIYVTCSKLSGLTCVNSLQARSKKCQDYAIRVYCDCDPSNVFEKKPEVTTIAPTTPYPGWPVVGPECDVEKLKVECAIPCNQVCMFYRHYLKLSGQCYDDSDCTSACMDPLQVSICPEGSYMSDNSTCIEAADCNCRLRDGLPLPGGMRVQISKCEWCECTNNELQCEILPGCIPTSTEVIDDSLTSSFTTPIVYTEVKTTSEVPTMRPPLSLIKIKCNEWTPWMNMRRNSEGDFQRLEDLRNQYEELCEKPKNISCRDAIAKIPYTQLEQSVTCSVEEGFICLNVENREDCFDYEVALYCECTDTDQTTEDTRSQTTPMITTELVPCDAWSPWINEHKPWLENGDYEYKSPEELKEKLSFCLEGSIANIECQEAGSGLDLSVNQDVMCDRNYGLQCRNEDQQNSLCLDFKIRYYCSCGTTTPPTRPTMIVPAVPTFPTVCDPSNYFNLLEQVPDSGFSATSSIGSNFAPALAARLNPSEQPKKGSSSSVYPGGAWSPAVDDKKQYLQIDLQREQNIYGFYISGSSTNPESKTTSFEVMASDDLILWSPVSLMKMRGPSVGTEVIKIMLPSPIEARYLRFLPKTWTNRIAMRVDVIGCLLPIPTPFPEITTLSCNDEMGLQNSELSDSQIDVSSVLGNFKEVYGKQHVRLNNLDGAWIAEPRDEQYIRFDFIEPRKLSGIVTRGSPLSDKYVSSYSVRYSPDGKIWNKIMDDETGQERIFPGNFDSETSVENHFPRLIEAQFLEIRPKEWNSDIALRVEVKGCYIPYPTVTTTTPEETSKPTKSPPHYCDICPGLTEDLYDRCYPCKENQRFDGKNCINPLNCPCFYNGKTYQRDAVFETNDCKRCTCLLDGEVQCQPLKCPLCDDEHERPVMSTTCACICKPCEENTKLCRLSGLCLEKDKWCDGIQHCQEDELHCTSLAPPECPVPDCPADWELILEVERDGINCPVYNCKAPQRSTPMNCPPPLCPFGYNIVLVPNKMGSACPTYDCQLPSTTAEPYQCPVPTCPKGYDVEVTPPTYEQSYLDYEADGCPQYKCATIGEPTAPCPPPSCPEGYDVSYPNPEDLLTLCPVYECLPIITTTACPPLSCPKGFQTMFIKSEDNELCPQYTCIKITRPPIKTTPMPTAPPCPDLVLPVCGPNEEIYQYNPLDPCPVFKCKTIGAPAPTQPATMSRRSCKIIGKMFTTFDGSEIMISTCHHILAREKTSSKFQVSIHKICTSQACTDSLNITIGDKSLILNSDLNLQWNGFSYTVEQVRKIGESKYLFNLEKLGDAIVFEPANKQWKAVWNKEANVYIEVSNDLVYQVDGLCGFYSDSPADDRTKPDGSLATSVRDFKDSWTIGQQNCTVALQKCSVDESKKAFILCNALESYAFTDCHDILPPASFLKGCVDKLCACLRLNKTEEECKCGILATYISSCLEKKPDARVADWRIASKCYKECSKGEEYSDCYKGSCEKSCQNLKKDKSLCSEDNKGVCLSGCFCEPGLVRKGDSCVAPEQCRDCICEGYGDPHYKTFDRSNFTLNGECSFIAARDKDPFDIYKFQIIVSNKKCDSETSAICTKSLKFLYGKTNEAKIEVADNTTILVTLNRNAIINYPFSNTWVNIERPDEDQVFLLVPEIQVEVSFNRENFGFEIRAPSQLFGGQLEGLCGDCNSIANDDYIMKDGKTTESIIEFGKSWALEESECKIYDKQVEFCSESAQKNDSCMELMNKEYFGECHPLEDPSSYISSCQLDLCTSDDPQKVACQSFAAYAKRCMVLGVCLQYRAKTGCTKQCPPSFEYFDCGRSCVKTCENYEKLQNNPELCDLSSTSGCFCPPGMVLDKGGCVNESFCITCDQEGHRMGETWKTNPCTTCECKTETGAICHTKSCPLEPICPQGYVVEEIEGTEDECCGIQKICNVRRLTNCTEPVAEICDYGKKLKLIETPGFCPEYVCVCMDADECPIPQKDHSKLKPGEVFILEKKGCCSQYIVNCSGNCTKTVCPLFHVPVLNEATKDHCCPTEICEPPKDACIFEAQYKIKNGREVQINKKGKSKPKLYSIGETWMDGLCSENECALNNFKKPVLKNTKQSCPSKEDHPDKKDYVLEEKLQPNKCCPKITRTSCIVDDEIIKMNETYFDPINGCRSVDCQLNKEDDFEKVEQMYNCDQNCQLGWEYRPSPLEPLVCCGQCHQIQCEDHGILHEVGDQWVSADFCTEYECEKSDTDGKIRIKSKDVQCTQPSEEERKSYLYKETKKPKTCCSEFDKQQCLFKDGTPIAVGEEKRDTDNNCLKIMCELSSDGTINRKELEQSCSRTCSKGHEYIEPSSESKDCCGECIQTHCVDENKLRLMGDTWENPKEKCYQYRCQMRDGTFMVVAIKRECPYFDPECPQDKILKDESGCCQLCDVVRETKKECAPEEIDPNDTIGMFILEAARSVGTCKNHNPVHGFKRCRGQCDSKTTFKSKGTDAEHVSECDCCRPSKVTQIKVKLKCDRGYSFQRVYDKIEECACQPCTGLQRSLYLKDQPMEDLTEFNPLPMLDDVNL